MKFAKFLYILILAISLSSCWDSLVNGRGNKNGVPQENIDSIKIDSSLLEPPIDKRNRPKSNNKALDTLKPKIAMANQFSKNNSL